MRVRLETPVSLDRLAVGSGSSVSQLPLAGEIKEAGDHLLPPSVLGWQIWQMGSPEVRHYVNLLDDGNRGDDIGPDAERDAGSAWVIASALPNAQEDQVKLVPLPIPPRQHASQPRPASAARHQTRVSAGAIPVRDVIPRAGWIDWR